MSMTDKQFTTGLFHPNAVKESKPAPAKIVLDDVDLDALNLGSPMVKAESAKPIAKNPLFTTAGGVDISDVVRKVHEKEEKPCPKCKKKGKDCECGEETNEKGQTNPDTMAIVPSRGTWRPHPDGKAAPKSEGIHEDNDDIPAISGTATDDRIVITGETPPADDIPDAADDAGGIDLDTVSMSDVGGGDVPADVAPSVEAPAPVEEPCTHGDEGGEGEGGEGPVTGEPKFCQFCGADIEACECTESIRRNRRMSQRTRVEASHLLTREQKMVRRVRENNPVAAPVNPNPLAGDDNDHPDAKNPVEPTKGLGFDVSPTPQEVAPTASPTTDVGGIAVVTDAGPVGDDVKNNPAVAATVKDVAPTAPPVEGSEQKKESLRRRANALIAGKARL